MTRQTYRDAGLDLELYEKSINGMVPFLRRTHNIPLVIDGFGGFASLFSLEYSERYPLFQGDYDQPVLVSSTDGVGTKLRVAIMTGKHDTVGIDLVAMSVNDCLCTGGVPLFFLDYIAMAKDDPELTHQLIEGISDGCMDAECSLVGGETAIMPGFYKPGDYDMAGFCVGVVEKDRIVNGRAIRPGDRVLGLASSGLHSNGYSLARKAVFDAGGLQATDFVPELGRTVGEELLEPTRIYVKAIKRLLKHYPVKRRVVRGMAHITGEGLEGNIPRILPPGRRVFLKKGSWPIPPVFTWLQRLGNVDEAEMYRVFNMGIGFVVIVSQYYADSVQRQLEEERVKSFDIGEVREGETGLEFV